MKDAIPYSLLIRAKRICSDNQEYRREANKIMTTLFQCQYPQQVLQQALIRAHDIQRKELLKTTEIKEDKRIRHILMHPINPD